MGLIAGLDLAGSGDRGDRGDRGGRGGFRKDGMLALTNPERYVMIACLFTGLN
jgi:hypothetical protein